MQLSFTLLCLLFIQKLRNEIIGEVCKDYLTYKDKVVIGHGGFGKVYKLNAEHAVKEEYKVYRKELCYIYTTQ